MAFHLFLDFDNTLMATERHALPSLINRFNTLHGPALAAPLTLDVFQRHFHGQSRETLCRNLSAYFGITVDCAGLYADRDDQVIAHLQSLPDGVDMAPGLMDALQALQAAGVVMSLVSNNAARRARAAMACAGNHQGEALAALLQDRLFEAGEIQKPDPDVYLRAIAATGAAPAHSAAVEDSPAGARAARAAGLAVFGYTGLQDHPDADALIKAGCVDTFSDWTHFPALLARHKKI